MNTESAHVTIAVSEAPSEYIAQQPLFEQEGARGVAVRCLLRIHNTSCDAQRLVQSELRAHQQWSDFDRALFQELVYGTLRIQARLDWVLTGFYHGEFVKCFPAVQHTLRVALYQILMLSKVPPQQAIESAVRLIERLKGPTYAATYASLLRAIARNVAGIRYPPRTELIQHLAVVHAHPQWLVRRWVERYGEEIAEQMLASNVERPSLFITANSTKTSVQALYSWLHEHEISCEASLLHSRSLRLNTFTDYEQLPIWDDGWSYSTDPLCAAIAENVFEGTDAHQVLVAGCRLSSAVLPVLEQCTAHHRHCIVWCELPQQLQWLTKECSRLGWTQPQIHSDLKEQTYDLVWVEAPSSGIGTWRRKPECKWRADSLDVLRAAGRIRHLLEACVPYVAPAGRLVITAATTEPEETAHIINWLITAFPDFFIVPPSLAIPPVLITNNTVQTLPHLYRGDSMYVVQLQRTS